MILPTQHECKAGLWALLHNGWIVGPIVETPEDCKGVYVQFGVNRWQIMPLVKVDIVTPRTIMEVGNRSDLLKYPHHPLSS